MKLPMPKDTLTSLSINPDTLKTLEVGSFLGTQDFINGSGDGFLILKDASKSVTREYEISSQTHSLSFTIPGPTLFRGQFTFSGQTLNSNFRVPQDISYSDQNASLIVYIYDNCIFFIFRNLLLSPQIPKCRMVKATVIACPFQESSLVAIF